MSSNIKFLFLPLCMLLLGVPLDAGRSKKKTSRKSKKKTSKQKNNKPKKPDYLSRMPDDMVRSIAGQIVKNRNQYEAYKELSSLRCVSKKMKKYLSDSRLKAARISMPKSWLTGDVFIYNCDWAGFKAPSEKELSKVDKRFYCRRTKWYFDNFITNKKCDYPTLFVALCNGYYVINQKWYWSKSDYKLPLFGAIETGHVKAAKMLILARADVNKEDNNETPLITAITKCPEQKRSRMVKMLLAHGAYTCLNFPLITATTKGYLDIVRLLLEAGATVDQLGFGGYAALYYAVRDNKWDIAKLLLAYDMVSITRHDAYGETPFDYMRKKDWDVLALMEEASQIEKKIKKKSKRRKK